MIDLVSIFLFYIALSALVYVFFGPWRKYKRDILRHKLLLIRDSLFLYEKNNPNIGEVKAYPITIDTLNGMIRLVDSLTYTKIYVENFYLKHNRVDRYMNQDSIEEFYNEAPEQYGARMQVALLEMHQVVHDYILATSIVFWPTVFLPAKLSGTVFPRFRKTIMKWSRSQIDGTVPQLDTIARYSGINEQEPIRFQEAA